MKVYARGNTWSYYFSYEGQRYRKGGFATQTKAKKAMNDKMYEVKNGFNIDDKTPFVHYFEEWIKVNKDGELDQKSLNTYNNAKNVFKEKFGMLAIGKLTQMKYRELLKEYGEGKYLKVRKDGRTTESVKKLNMCLKACLNDAVNEGIIAKNPSYGAKPKGIKSPKQESDKYLEKEVFLELKNEMLESKELSHFFIYLLCITGARFGEIQRMKYDYFNFKDNTVFLDGTKTDTSPRTIQLLPKEMLEVKKFMLSRHKNEDGYMFNTGKNLITHNSVLKVFKRFCLRKKLGNHTLHACRHSHASLLLLEGIRIEYISKRLGHADINITLKTYSHLLKDLEDSESEKMLELMAKY